MSVSTPTPLPSGQLDPGGPETITYASGARTRAGRAMIKSIENLTGRPRLLRLAADYQREIEQGYSFWEVMCRRYRVTLDLPGPGLANIPPDGPLVCVANHPFGILDGLTFGLIMAQARKDFKILANSVFVKAPEIEPHILPIDFAETREAMKLNIETRKEALSYLKKGGCIGVFPGGAVSTGKRFYTAPFDPEWKTFTAKLIQQSGAKVSPMFFDGRNSRLFQIASHVSDSLRLALLLSEFEKRVGAPVRAVIGAPIPQAVIDGYKGDARGLMAFLREHTYSLSPTPIRRAEIGKQW
ncbi:MAG: lysophospholipid acyltransferase family protein [Neomegalonema sp.]|nr:lysophospholipid acyltransferase family protein [Neomegalonema sp.]